MARTENDAGFTYSGTVLNLMKGGCGDEKQQLLRGIGERVLEIRLIDVTLTHNERRMRGDCSYYLQFQDRRARDDLITEHMRYATHHHERILGHCDCRRCIVE